MRRTVSDKASPSIHGQIDVGGPNFTFLGAAVGDDNPSLDDAASLLLLQVVKEVEWPIVHVSFLHPKLVNVISQIFRLGSTQFVA